MFKGFVLSESLKSPTVLNRLNKTYINIEAHPESSSHFWHLFKIKVDNKEIGKVSKMLSGQMKKGWYAHLWNSKTVYFIFSRKVFTIPRERKWKSEEYQKCKEYALKHGVEKRYLDFLIED